MKRKPAHGIRESFFLYDQAKKAGLNYGCVEISLQALGASFHLVDLLDHNSIEHSALLDIIERQGFRPYWITDIPPKVTGPDLENLFEGNYSLPYSPPSGELAGYLGWESNLVGQEKHVIAILPRHHMSRNERRRLKKEHGYVVVDTTSGGTLRVPAENLAKYINRVTDSGGRYEVSQLWRRELR